MTLLGKSSPTPERYAPELLDPIPRAQARQELGLDPGQLPFYGEDIWHGWELSWLEAGGRPRNAVLRCTLPADSPNLVESKSFKLYLNSLNRTEFASQQVLEQTLQSDLEKVVGARPGIEILPLDAAELAITPLPGTNIDSLPCVESALYLRWHPEGNGVEPPLLASASLRVTPSAGLLADLRALLGRERVHLIRG